MPRIRSIKPEFCVSEQIAECSTNARLLFVLMWMFCDDAGRHPASVLRLKAECFPFDPLTREEMSAYVHELHAAGLLVSFEFEGQRFWQVTGWKHQKIDRPNAKYGPVTQEKRGQSYVTTGADISPYVVEFAEHSTSTRRAFDESSPPDRKGEEGKGRERKGVEGSGLDDESPKPTATDSPVANARRTNVQHSPPSVAEVRQYMADQGYRDDAEAFVDHYTANGWVQGRGKPIRDWQAAVRNWQRNDFSTGSARGPSGKMSAAEAAQRLREKHSQKRRVQTVQQLVEGPSNER